MKRLPGRPSKKESERCVKKNTSYSNENYRYIVKMLEERQWDLSGFFSKVVNEIIADHVRVKRFKEAQLAKLKNQEEMLNV